MVMCNVTILTMYSNTRCSRSESILNSVYRLCVDICRHIRVAVITRRHKMPGFALLCPMFRPHHRLLRNTPSWFNLSYPMRSSFPCISLARPSCTIPVFSNPSAPSSHRSFCSSLHTHNHVHILHICDIPITLLCRNRSCPIRWISTVCRVTQCFSSCRQFSQWSRLVQCINAPCK